MIISHGYGLISIKTPRPTGTSLEFALSQFCGNEDTITPLGPQSERMRIEFGHRNPQICRLPFAKYSAKEWIEAARCTQAGHLGGIESSSVLARVPVERAR